MCSGKAIQGSRVTPLALHEIVSLVEWLARLAFTTGTAAATQSLNENEMSGYMSDFASFGGNVQATN